MAYFDLRRPVSTELKGVGDEPNKDVFKGALKTIKVVGHRGKRDEHSRCPSGLPKAFCLNERE